MATKLAAGVKSVAGLPLIVKDRLLGVLYLHSLTPGAFRYQLPLLTAFASQAAIALENARLYGAIQRELTERKQAELDAVQTRTTLETALASMSDAVMISDADGNLIEAP